VLLLAPLLAFSAGGCVYLTRVSIPTNTPPVATGSSEAPSVSSDGRLVAFASAADDLVSSDTNLASDAFVRDLKAGATTIASMGKGPIVIQANESSHDAVVSGNGRFVAFDSVATNLVASDTNNAEDVFVRDLQTRTNDLVSVDSYEGQLSEDSLAPSISDDGRFVSFETNTGIDPFDTNGLSDIYLRDRLAGTTTLVSIATSGLISSPDGASYDSALSGDGTHIVFTSTSNNLVTGDTNGKADVFELDLTTNVLTRVSVATGGGQLDGNSALPAVSEDGRYVAFSSDATNAVTGDTNGARDVFVRDTVAGTTERVSISSAGTQGNGTSQAPTISGDGRFVGFESTASNLVSDDTNGVSDVFVRDRLSNVTIRESTMANLGQANGASTSASLSSDGRTIAFLSLATNLDPNNPDNDTQADVYVRATRPPTVTTVTPGSVARNATVGYTITGDGFLTNPNPIVVGPNGTTFTITNVTNTSITGTLTVSGSTPTGTQSVIVGNPGTGPGTTAGASGMCTCLNIT
jgi:Tol biopolymer transport system component